MSHEQERLEELLAQRATEGLAEAEAAELARLLERNPGVDADAYDRAAAAVHLAELGGRLEEMPAHLRRALTAAAPQAGAGRGAAPRALAPAPRPRASGPWPWLAVAAALLVAIAGWWPRIVSTPVPTAAERAALVAAGARRIDWTATEDPFAVGASGDVVWDAASQTGFMRFVGLAANQPTQLQYQLWIFDRQRDERYPVDGGVFDIPAGAGEVIVPIRARVPVGDATLFAVTVEPAGGVVVSTRERIVLLAQTG
jgi:anti-sigma-K factor RskA